MQSENILSSSLDDLLFENRNKLYGAYVLRRDYPLRLQKALAAMLALAGGFVLLTFMQSDHRKAALLISSEGHVLREIRADAHVIPPPPARKTAAAPTAKWVSNLMFTPEVDSTDRLQDISRLAIASVDIPQHCLPGDAPALVPAGVQEPAMPPPPVAASMEPVTDPDVQPAYPGGPQALLAFLQKNLQMPLPLEQGEAVQVQVKFVVGFDGELQTFAVQKDGGPAFNDEVIRVLKRMPRWVPGKKGSRAVAAYYSLPVKFTGDE